MQLKEPGESAKRPLGQGWHMVWPAKSWCVKYELCNLRNQESLQSVHWSNGVGGLTSKTLICESMQLKEPGESANRPLGQGLRVVCI